MSSRIPGGFVLLAVLAAEPAWCGADWIFAPPTAPPGGEAALSSVDGSSVDDVWAVGVAQPAAYESLIEHFDGASWTQFPVPDAQGDKLRAVTVIAPDHAVAVGTHTPAGTTAQPLAMEWNGADWQVVPTPELPGGRLFWAVDHTPAGETWVAGHQSQTAFLARRIGGSWDLEFAPPVGSFRNRFYALHARSDSEIWVVGTRSDAFGEFEILLQRFDGGSSWTTFDVPSPGTIDALTGVTAFAPNDAWAVGYFYHIPLYLSQPLIVHYDGTSWTVVELPDYPEGSVRLEGMAATAPDDIYAAGTYATAAGVPRPFMLHYDGVSWSEVLLPSSGGSAEWFLGMCATPDGAVWAVGQYFDGTSTEPMGFHRSGPVIPVGAPPSIRTPVVVVASPNPFRHSTSIGFEAPRAGLVDVSVYDASGRRIATLPVGRGSGPQAVAWDGRTSDGGVAAAGTYFVRVRTEAGSVSRRVVRIR